MVPLTVAARSCRTPRSRRVGSQGAGVVRCVVRWVATGGADGGGYRCSVFLQANVFDDARDTARAALPTRVSDVRRDALRRGVGVEEAMPQDVTGHFLGATVVACGAACLARERLGAMPLQGLTHVVIPRRAEAECLSRLARTEGLTCALDAHRQLASDVVLCEDGKGALRSNEPVLLTIT